MTRADRIRAACERFAEGPPEGHAETVNQGIEAALDAALADAGGLDGLERLKEAACDQLAAIERVCAARDRLREALRSVLTFHLNPSDDGPKWKPLSAEAARAFAEAALDASGAGT